jgi:hypothetical protein
MPFKTEYLTAVGITQATYTSQLLAAKRVCDIHGAARTGRISASDGNQLWVSFFQPLLPQASALPAIQAVYDDFATRQMLQLVVLLQQRQKGDFGHAQKMFNLYLKDCWALNSVPTPLETFLHLPLDRTVLSKLVAIPPPWTRAWTKVVVNLNTQQQVVDAYLQIQNSFRTYWRQPHIRRCFSSPIEMDQFIWHRI